MASITVSYVTPYSIANITDVQLKYGVNKNSNFKEDFVSTMALS